MKFNYPYKVYIVGLIFLLLILTYGIVVIVQIFSEGLMFIMFLALLMLVSYHISKYYIQKIKYYIDINVEVNDNSIKFHDHEINILIEKESLDVIFLAKHMQNFKVHRVIHIFKTDGTYCYITNEIDHFDKLTKLLKTTFPNKYYETNHLIKGFHEITKGFLFEYR